MMASLGHYVLQGPFAAGPEVLLRSDLSFQCQPGRQHAALGDPLKMLPLLGKLSPDFLAGLLPNFSGAFLSLGLPELSRTVDFSSTLTYDMVTRRSSGPTRDGSLGRKASLPVYGELRIRHRHVTTDAGKIPRGMLP